MLYAGVLEDKYADVRKKALTLFVLSILAAMAVAVSLAYAFAHKIIQPVHRLIEASAQVSQGNLSPEIGPISKSEIGRAMQTVVRLGWERFGGRRSSQPARTEPKGP